MKFLVYVIILAYKIFLYMHFSKQYSHILIFINPL